MHTTTNGKHFTWIPLKAILSVVYVFLSIFLLICKIPTCYHDFVVLHKKGQENINTLND